MKVVKIVIHFQLVGGNYIKDKLLLKILDITVNYLKILFIMIGFLALDFNFSAAPRFKL
jgi:hypothetical protein